MSLIDRAIRRPVATTLSAILVLLLGVLGYARMPVSSLPEVDVPTLAVFSSLPGATAEAVSVSITSPLERELALVPGVIDMTSSSSAGSSGIFLQFEPGRDIEAARKEVDVAINNALPSLPQAMPQRPEVAKAQPPDGQIISVAVSSELLPSTKVDVFAEAFVAQRISRIAGVGGLEIHGGQKPAVRVQVDPLKLASLGLSLDQIRKSLVAAALPAPSGTIENLTRSLAVGVPQVLAQPEDVAAISIPKADGAPVRLGEVAKVREGPVNLNDLAWVDGRQAVIIDVYKQPGSKVLQVIAAVRAAVDELKKDLPPSVKVDVIGDRTQVVVENLREAKYALAVTVFIVVIVVAAFLRGARLVLIPVVAIPISLAGAAALASLVGYGVNNLTLIALIVAVGFVIDDAIVVFENIVRRSEGGEVSSQAAIDGTRQVAFTVVSMTLSIVAALIPLLFMDGLTGRMFREFAYVIAAALLCSALVSLTVTPMMCRLLLTERRTESSASRASASHSWFEKFDALYSAALSWTLEHKAAVAVTIALSLPLTIAVFVAIPKGFFPDQDSGQILGSIKAPVDISLATMAKQQRDIMDQIARDSAVESVHGWPSPTSPHLGRITINLKPFNVRRESVSAVASRVHALVTVPPGITFRVRPRQELRAAGGSSKTQIDYVFQGTDERDLYAFVPKAVEVLKKLPQLSEAWADINSYRTSARIRIDYEHASRLGVGREEIDQTLRDSLGGRKVATLVNGFRQYRLILELDPQYRSEPELLMGVHVASEKGVLVPLSAFSSSEPSKMPLEINHQDQFPSISVSLTPAPGIPMGEAVDAVEAALRGLSIPASVHGSFQGNAKAFQATLSSQPYLILGAILMVYIVLGVLYESFVHPLTILSTLPSAGLGALVALWVTKGELNLISMVGLILLVGIVKKNAIMMIDLASSLRRQGLDAMDAAKRACELRFRPIMMTTAAALVGAIPLIFGSGPGSELRSPIGISMLAGLLVSQVVTLFTTPVVYVYLDNLAAISRSRFVAWASGVPTTGRVRDAG